jgi:predicted HTH transcriptional regulator
MSSLFEGFTTMRLVRVAPSLRERLERRIAAMHHKAVVGRLRRFREGLEDQMTPEDWTTLEAPMVTLLSDVCDALALTGAECAAVLGKAGERTLAEILESRPVPRSHALLNERQVQALHFVRQHRRITNRQYSALCPDVSAETLRLDLADLAARGLLVKNGRKKGTHYILPI